MISGKNLVAGKWLHSQDAKRFKTVDPILDKPLPYDFQEATSHQISAALEAASKSFELFAHTSFKQRAAFLESIKVELDVLQEHILTTYTTESALPEGRAKGEFQRTKDQIQRFIELLNEGSFATASIHTQGPDLRKVLHPIGPVVVFGASNFPLAFSTVGGDTISAFAAGCPVVVKAHPYHAGTSEWVAQAIANAIEKSKLPLGIFSHLGGQSHEVGSQLVCHPLTKGVGFTGSFSGGKALYDLAQKREEPIPVFDEMGSINPIFVLEHKLQSDSGLAEALTQSVTLGTGQFCTNPGLIVACNPSGKIDLSSQIKKHLEGMQLPPMVHSNIEKQYNKQLSLLKLNDKLNSIHTSESCLAAVASVKAAQFLKDKSFSEEVFGPFTLVVDCKTVDEVFEVAGSLAGQLTATILSETKDYETSKGLLIKLQSKAGRILFEGVPTGVAVTQSMHHGGPYPASTDSRFTSVGTDAIYRWLRPIAFQDCPNELLPDTLKNENPLGLQRSIDGKLTSAAL